MNLGQWIGLIALLSSLYILWEIRQVILLVFAAVVLAISLNRLAKQFQRFGIKRWIAITLATALLLGVLVGICLVIVPAFANQFQELTNLLPKGIQTLNREINLLRTNVPEWVKTSLPDVNTLVQQIQPLANQLVTRSFTIFSNSLGVVLNFLLVVVLTLMFLADPQAYRQGFIYLFPSFYRRRMDEILVLVEASLGKWVVGALISMCVIGLMSWIGLSFLQVRAALANAIVAGLLNLIPNIGPTFSVIPPMAIGLLDASWKPLAVFGLYFAIQQFESNFLTPYIMSQQVSLLPAVTLMSQIFFASFFGFLGLFLAIPLTVVGQVLVQEILIKDVLNPWQSSANLELRSSVTTVALQPADSTQAQAGIREDHLPDATAPSAQATAASEESHSSTTPDPSPTEKPPQ